jgi:hypothetical protein
MKLLKFILYTRNIEYIDIINILKLNVKKKKNKSISKKKLIF